jgi:hypothetical protein
MPAQRADTMRQRAEQHGCQPARASCCLQEPVDWSCCYSASPDETVLTRAAWPQDRVFSRTPGSQRLCNYIVHHRTALRLLQPGVSSEQRRRVCCCQRPAEAALGAGRWQCAIGNRYVRLYPLLVDVHAGRRLIPRHRHGHGRACRWASRSALTTQPMCTHVAHWHTCTHAYVLRPQAWQGVVSLLEQSTHRQKARRRSG